MSATVSLEWIGETLRTIQAEQRTIRDENRLIRLALSDAINALMERIGTFEALIDIRIDQLSVLAGDILTRLDRIEAKLP